MVLREFYVKLDDILIFGNILIFGKVDECIKTNSSSWGHTEL